MNREKYVNASVPELIPFSPMSDLTFEADAVIILGRGIEQSSDGSMQPTRLVEHGAGDRYRHTGKRDNQMKGYSQDAVVGGGNMNTIATAEYLERYFEKNRKFPLIIFAAGKPDYYLKDSPVSEGEVMRDKLLKLLPSDLPLGTLEIVQLPNNQRTEDDLQTSLREIQQRKLREVDIITIGLHIPRSWDITKKKLYEIPDLKGKFRKVQLIDSDRLLVSRGDRGSERDNIYKKVLQQLKKTSAYKRTKVNELHGLKMLREGTY